MKDPLLNGIIEGEVLKRTYKLIRQISEGVHAHVYLAVDQTNGEEYAVKFIKSDLIDKTLFHEQLRKKISWRINLDARHIARIVDIGVFEASDEEYSFIIMEHLDGKGLNELLAARSEPFEVRQTLRIVRQIAAGLDEALRHDVQAHRDLIPSKIHVDSGWMVRITDFTVALHASGDVTISPDDPIGTPEYMSPEQINDPLDVDIRTDIYALGVIAFEMLMGKRPFEGSVREIFTQRLQKEPLPISRPELTEARTAQVRAIVNRCLAKNRDDRFQSPIDLMQAIDAFLQESEEATFITESAVQDAHAPTMTPQSQATTTTSGLADLETRIKKMEAGLQRISQTAGYTQQQTAVPEPSADGSGGLLRRLSFFAWALLIGAIVLLCMAVITLARIGSSDNVIAPIITAQADSDSSRIALAATVESLAERPTITPIPTQTPTLIPTSIPLPTETPTSLPPTETPIPPPSLPRDQVNGLLFRNERLWVVFSGRLAEFDGENWQIFTAADGLPGGNLTSVLLDDRGDIWVGASTGLGHLDNLGWKIFTVASERIPSDTITAVAFDGTNRWFGTDSGLARFDGSTWDFFEPPTLLANEVTALAVDDGLWVGTSAGLNRFDGGVWSVISIDDGSIGNEITAVASDETGGLWVGTSQGLSFFDSVNWQIITNVDELEENTINDIAIGADDEVWVGTENGILRYDGVTWIMFTVADGLASNKITAVTTDSIGNVWVGTSAGLMLYDDTAWQSVEVPGA